MVVERKLWAEEDELQQQQQQRGEMPATIYFACQYADDDYYYDLSVVWANSLTWMTLLWACVILIFVIMRNYYCY